MSRKTGTVVERRKKSALVVAKASACTWVVAFSRQMIPGALFRSKEAALNYAKPVPTEGPEALTDSTDYKVFRREQE